MSSLEPHRAKHSTLWLEDGNLILLPSHAISGQPRAYRVNRSIVTLHSRTMDAQTTSKAELLIDTVKDEELEAFLQHIYSDHRISLDTPVPRLANIIRATARMKLDSPEIHSEALEYIRMIFPDEPIFAFEHEHLEDAAKLVRDFPEDLKSIRRLVYYALIRTTNEGHEDTASLPSPLPKILEELMGKIIDEYSPTLYEPGRSSFHMDCSDVLGGRWGEFVGHPGMEEGEVYQPFESLERIRNLPWSEAGVCDQCVRDQRGKWAEEAQDIWEKMDGWIDELEAQFAQ